MRLLPHRLGVMRNMRTTNIYIIILLLAGCASTENFTRLYENASVEIQPEEWRGYTVIEGRNLVLEKSYSKSSLPFVVDGISGYKLHVELPGQALAQGDRIIVPTEKSKAYLHTLNAPSYKNITDIEGSIKIIEVTSNGAKLEIDVNSPSKSWSYAGVDFFRYAKHSCIGKVDWACEFYSR
jgi:hypothetical protein